MGRIAVELDEPLVEVLRLLDQPVDRSVREILVLELYRRGVISSGKAADLLNISKLEFIQFSGRLGIPFFQLSDEQMDAEAARVRSM